MCVIRDARLEDLDDVWGLEVAVFGDEAWSFEVMREELTSEYRRYLVLEGDDGSVQGYAGVLCLGSEGDVQTIALASKVRGLGYGRRLLNALIDVVVVLGVRELFLEVRADNCVARGLYESLGFVGIGVRVGYYQPGSVDAVVMRLRVGGC